MSEDRLLKIHRADTVAVALDAIAAGARLQVSGQELRAIDAIPRGHKVALQAIAVGKDVVKYGAPIGHATQHIAAGALVHTHNLATNLEQADAYRYQPVNPVTLIAPGVDTFPGYCRESGAVGTRNMLWIIPTVGCVNAIAETLARQALATGLGEGLDGIAAFPHPFGCSQLGEDHARTRQLLANLARHPNAGGVLIVGLGCENNRIAEFQPLLADQPVGRIRYLNCQDAQDEMAEGLALLRELAEYARRFQREPVSVAELCIGLKCGGSDAFSGLTANPVVGRVADRIVAAGGSALLTELPEMFGAEHLLLNSCADATTFNKLTSVLDEMKDYYRLHGQVIYENPSPGNKDGGITTLEEKSLGCTQKAGSSPVMDVLRYGERLTRKGLTVLEGPGNDLVAISALAAAGAQVILFTTGRGTPLGSPVPVIKVATNSALATHKPHWIDADAGGLLAGSKLEMVADELYSMLLAVAGGKLTSAEKAGQYDLAIWKDGVTL